MVSMDRRSVQGNWGGDDGCIFTRNDYYWKEEFGREKWRELGVLKWRAERPTVAAVAALASGSLECRVASSSEGSRQIEEREEDEAI